MSGGTFNHDQSRINRIIEEIREALYRQGEIDGYGYKYPEFSKETIKAFRDAIYTMKKAYIYAQRIDWLLAGDDGEESFLERLKDSLSELDAINKGTKGLA